MNPLHKLIVFLFTGALFMACVPHRSFVATPFEPVTVKKKGDIEMYAGLRPFKYYSAGFTAALTNFMAVRAGYSGFFGLDNFNASLIFFKDYKHIGFFAAPAFNYQHNVINRSEPRFFFFNRRSYDYNCEYLSPALVLGIKLGSNSNGISHQLIFKAQYNVTLQYEYNYLKVYPSGSSYYYRVIDDETLNHKLQPFFSFEPAYVFLNPISKHFTFKAQLGLNFCQKVLQHEYQFQVGDYTNTTIQKMSALHPKSAGINISVGLIFNGSVRAIEPVSP